jgi:prepilin-type processing-associated H-X9-DG protein
LLVALVIIAILIALLIPAVQATREAARRVQCANNLRLMALALHNYHYAFKIFPCGHYSPPGDKEERHLGFLVSLLPYAEQQAVYNSINLWHGPNAPSNRTAKNVRLMTFVCPSDSVAAASKMASTNYFGNAGAGPSVLHGGQNDKQRVRGVLYQCSNVRISDITDGSSNTLIMAESLVGSPVPSPARQYVLKNEALPNQVADDAGAGEFLQGNNRQANRGSSWMDGRYLQSLLIAKLPPNSQFPDTAYKDFSGGVSGPRSGHPGGCNLGMGDGSVQFISSFIDQKFMTAMATMNGNEQ